MRHAAHNESNVKPRTISVTQVGWPSGIVRQCFKPLRDSSSPAALSNITSFPRKRHHWTDNGSPLSREPRQFLIAFGRSRTHRGPENDALNRVRTDSDAAARWDNPRAVKPGLISTGPQSLQFVGSIRPLAYNGSLYPHNSCHFLRDGQHADCHKSESCKVVADRRRDRGFRGAHGLGGQGLRRRHAREKADRRQSRTRCQTGSWQCRVPNAIGQSL